jgi:tryptophan 2,3-dioxygenase
MHSFFKKSIGICAATMLAAAPALAQTWSPTKPVTLVVPVAPGSSNDLIARILADKLPARLGQPVVVENRPGASGMVGVASMARAAPDGHTIAIAPSDIYMVSHLTPKAGGANFDVIKDVVPMLTAGTAPILIVAQPSINVKTPQELVAYLKKEGPVSFSSPGTGSPMHIAGELLKRRTETQLNHVPYRGVLPAVNAVLAGELPLGIVALAGAAPFIAAGKLVPVAAVSASAAGFQPLHELWRLPAAGRHPRRAEAALARPQRDAVHHPAPDQRAVDEADAARAARRHRGVSRDKLGSAFKMLARVSRIMEQLVHAWDVLATMTPPEYSAIRPYLASSSGFQSAQYRCIEFALGNKNAAMLKPHEHRPDLLAQVQAAYESPSLYDEALRLLARRGLPVPAASVDRDWTQRHVESDAVEQAWLVVYRDPERYWDLYQLGEELTDLEDAFRLWRFRHVTTVERVIGFKRGTGGTGGVSYLRKMLDVVLFPEIWRLRTDL